MGCDSRANWVCQVFCVNDLDFVLGFGFVVALGVAVVVGYGDGVQGKGAFPLPLHVHVERPEIALCQSP
jgi:hypothetical protein